MVFGLFSKKVVGLEIGPRELKMVVLQQEGDFWRLVDCASEPTPPSALEPDSVRHPGALGVAIGRLRNALPMKGARIRMTTGVGSVISRRFTLPKMDAAKVRDTIMMQQEQFIPTSDHSVVADVAICPSSSKTETSVIIASMPHQSFSNLRRSCRVAGIQPEELQPPSAPLYRLAHVAGLIGDTADVAIIYVDIDHFVRSFVYRSGMPLAARMLEVPVDGGYESLVEIRQSIQLGGHMPRKVIVMGEIPSSDWYRELVSVINRPMWITADAESETNEDVEVIRMPAMDLLPDQGYCVAVGLALPPAPGEPVLNLFRARLLQGSATGWDRTALWLAAAALGTMAYGFWWYQEMNTANVDLALASGTVPQSAAVLASSRTNSADQGKEFLLAYQEWEKRVRWSEVVKDLQNRTVASTVTMGTISISGGSPVTISFKATAPSLEHVQPYLQNLQSSAFFTPVPPDTYRRPDLKTTGVEFDMKVTVKAGAKQP